MTVPNEAFYIAIQSGEVPIVSGNPGFAKTASNRSFCQAVQRKLYVLIGSITDPTDFGIPFLVNKARKQLGKDCDIQLIDGGDAYFVMAAAKWVMDIVSDTAPWLIFFDETTTSPPPVEAAMLRVICDKWVGNVQLPDNVWMAAACNPAEIATNGRDLSAAMANRLIHLPWEMDWDAWDEGTTNRCQFPSPQFRLVPNGWESELDGVGAMFKAFRNHRPDAFYPSVDSNGRMKLSRKELSGPWPSPRTWTIAQKCRAAAMAAGCDKAVLSQLLHGCVGAVAHEYETWEEHLDLPDPGKAIEKAVNAMKTRSAIPYEHPDRPDKVIAFLGAIVAHIMANPGDPKRYNAERWEAGLAIIHAASLHEKDVAISCCRGMFRSTDGTIAKPKGAQLPKDFVNDLAPVIRKAIMN